MADMRYQRDRLREQTCELLRALGIDPAATPLDAYIHWDGTTLYVEQHVRDGDSRLVLSGRGPARELAVVTVDTDIYAVPLDGYRPSYEEAHVGD